MTQMESKPRINLLYYKNLLDKCFLRFFEEFNADFNKTDGGYVFSNKISQVTIKKTFVKYLKDELKNFIPEFKEAAPEYLFIIGSCIPGDNILLNSFGEDEYFPQKFRKILETVPDVKYYLKESDIHIDIRMFNAVFEDIFLDFLNRKVSVARNVFFIRHNRLDCYMMYKTIKQRFGSLTVNLHKKFFTSDDRCIHSVNENIDMYSHRKLEILRSEEMRPYRDEIYRYMDNCIMEV